MRRTRLCHFLPESVTSKGIEAWVHICVSLGLVLGRVQAVGFVAVKQDFVAVNNHPKCELLGSWWFNSVFLWLIYGDVKGCAITHDACLNQKADKECRSQIIVIKLPL
ncbi:hypothetical protein MKX01_036989 [Papaver californicum]|nr:hypothetical protein MKX01_036989 [Papaver californicum]